MTETPDPVPPDYLRALIERAGITQREAAGRLHVDDTTVRKWLSPVNASTHRDAPWAAVELLRRLLSA